jgi:transposase-like protein DUF772
MEWGSSVRSPRRRAGLLSPGSPSEALHLRLSQSGASSRRLEREACRNVEVMWLIGRLAPDHKTIADFRNGDPEGLREVRCVMPANGPVADPERPPEGRKVRPKAGQRVAITTLAGYWTIRRENIGGLHQLSTTTASELSVSTQPRP